MRPFLEEQQRKRSGGLVLKRESSEVLKIHFRVCSLTPLRAHACQHMSGGQRTAWKCQTTTLGSQFPLLGGIHLRLLDFLANALNCLNQLTALPGGVDMRC